MLWEVDIYPREGEIDRAAADILADVRDLHLTGDSGDEPRVVAARGYLIESGAAPGTTPGDGGDSTVNIKELDRADVERLTRELLADTVVEATVVAPVGDAALAEPIASRAEVLNGGHANGQTHLLHVLFKPGVMDPVALSAQRAMADALEAGGSPHSSQTQDSPRTQSTPPSTPEVSQVRTLRKVWISGVDRRRLDAIVNRVLANDAIEQVVIGPLTLDHLPVGGEYEFNLVRVPIRELSDDDLMRLSREGQLYLQLAEMQTIRQYFRDLDRDPTDIELETLAQTWSEHCSHKTLAGRIAYRDDQGERTFDNMLKETIFAATMQIREELGDGDWCVSVFKDNAGIVRFEGDWNLAFKVETHNHPSALEPYGGANTGLGGVIRDILGVGLGAKPIASTDVFCFAPPDTSPEELPPGVLHPRRVMRRVVAGVRDYGNRMGIPTVNGAIYFDERYLGNPLVYCGNVGLIPHDKSFKQPRPGDWVVAVGGRTGRDGIHGATFSSAELTSQSEELSGGAVQIGNAITEKMVTDVVLAARDRGLFTAVTDCGAGGFSSAVGEMGEEIGAEVWLDRVPTKYDGLSYTELWISEAQERMVLSVPPEKWDELDTLCRGESVEATIIGRYEPTGRLTLKYEDQLVGDLPMEFLHNGRPPVVRQAVYDPPPQVEMKLPARAGGGANADGATSTGGAADVTEVVSEAANTGDADQNDRAQPDFTGDLKRILGSLNVASKEWVIRQYDHEVQAGSVVKPLVGAESDGPSDAAVVRPLLDSNRGVVISCGMNPRYGDLDTYHMAASAIDEAVRNCVAVGGDPSRIALLDNFCWGDCECSETLGSLVRAALACRDLASAWRMPFISGKDSLNNEFSYEDVWGAKHTIAIPPSLLISAIGQVDDVRRCVTMDLKTPGSLLYQVGLTKHELGGSHFALVNDLSGGRAPTVDLDLAHKTFHALHAAIRQGLVCSCHDLSEGGLAAAAAEMALAGGLGATILLENVPGGAAICETQPEAAVVTLLFSESNSRFLCEVAPNAASAFEAELEVAAVPFGRIGRTTTEPQFIIRQHEVTSPLIYDTIDQLKFAWQSPLRW